MSIKSTSISELNELRHQAVRLRLEGKTLSTVSETVGLSTPTVVAAMKAYKAGGWEAINVKPRGRPKRSSSSPASTHLDQLKHALCSAAVGSDQLWNTSEVRNWLANEANVEISEQTAASYLQQWDLVPFNAHRNHRHSKQPDIRSWLDNEHTAFVEDARRQSNTVFWVGKRTRFDGTVQLFAHSLRGRCNWKLYATEPNEEHRSHFLDQLCRAQSSGLGLVLMPSASEFENHLHELQHCEAPLCLETMIEDSDIHNSDGHEPKHKRGAPTQHQSPRTTNHSTEQSVSSTIATRRQPLQFNEGLNMAEQATIHRLTHLQRLEAESIHIMREVVAEAENPVMLYSIGKDSAVMLHIAQKAFFPGEIPFPLLHIDTTWKFREMYEFRDQMIKKHGFELLTYVNQDGVNKGVNPFTHGAELHTDIMKTQALKQALDQYGFDVALGGARRDEEKSRAKERVLSFRSTQHRWDPKNQRPELWSLYNNRIRKGESIRAFPLANWTELDIWQYIQQQDIEVVPLYFAKERAVVERDGALIMVDDERLPLKNNETIKPCHIRFRTLGCYPLTGAIESQAATLKDIIQEMLVTKTSERHGRLIDNDTASAMEKKKQEGYF